MAVAMTVALAAPSGTMAGNETFYAGDAAGTSTGSRHDLTSVSGFVYDTTEGAICVNALEDNGELAGSYYCTSPTNRNVSHPYCGCKPRRGYVTRSSSALNWFEASQAW